jgi:diguanylate cyclase (GGDEF)-like protein
VHKRYRHPFGLLLMDIDGLKRINDSHGHQAGDRVLMQVAMSLRRSIRSVDTAARIGGDEFCVLLPQQDLKSAAKLAARLATAVEEEVASPGDPPVAMSIGVAASPEHGDDADSLLDTADRAMYRAKAAGEGIALGDPPGTQGVTAEEATT